MPSAPLLSSPARLRTHLDLPTGQDDLLWQLLAAATYAIQRYCQRWFLRREYTEYHDGLGRPSLLLREYPVDPAAGLRCWLDGNGGYGLGSFDAALDSTLGSANYNPRWDYDGDGDVDGVDAARWAADGSPGPFGAGTELALGRDFALAMDATAGAGTSGLLVRLGGGGGRGGDWPMGGSGLWGGDPYHLSAGYRAAGWPVGQGNVKVRFTAGWHEWDLPPDIQLAADQFAATVYRTRRYGGAGQASSRHLGEYSYTLMMTPPRNVADQIGSVQQLLAPYVRRVL